MSGRYAQVLICLVPWSRPAFRSALHLAPGWRLRSRRRGHRRAWPVCVEEPRWSAAGECGADARPAGASQGQRPGAGVGPAAPQVPQAPPWS